MKNINSVKNSPPPVKSSKGFFNLVAFYYKKYLWQCFLVLTFTALSSACVILTPKLMQKLINPVVLQGPFRQLIIYILIIIGLYILSGVFNFFQSFLGGIIAKKIEIDLRIKLLNKLVDLDMQFYSQKKTGEILTKLITDTAIIGDQTQQIPVNFLSSVFTFTGSIIILLTISIKLTLVTLGVALTILLSLILMFGFFKKINYKVKKILTEINGNVTDRINVVGLIKASATENYEKKRFKQVHKLYYKASFKEVGFSSVIVAVMILGISSLNIIVLLAGVIMMHKGTLGVASPEEGLAIIISFILGINILIFPIISFVRIFNSLASASTSAVRIKELLEETAHINPNAKGTLIETITKGIVFENVTFHYPDSDQLILKDFNYNFKYGKSYAFVGGTGVGKSTISRLLLRFYDPNLGRILINETEELKTVNLESYLKHVGYVEQEPQIFNGTFIDNISYGIFNVTHADIIEACKKANLHNFIISLKLGYQTILGERGFILSGGQKQRLLIARMFLKNPAILILDEATSSLDNIVEKEIQKNLDELMQGRTTFIIAHRLSTIKNVDEILVLEKNNGIVQIGDFATLRNQDGCFKTLYDAGMVS